MSHLNFLIFRAKNGLKLFEDSNVDFLRDINTYLTPHSSLTPNPY